MTQITKADIKAWRKVEAALVHRRNNILYALQAAGKRNILKQEYWDRKAKKELFGEVEGQS